MSDEMINEVKPSLTEQKIMVMPNEQVESHRMPRPLKDEFESFADL